MGESNEETEPATQNTRASTSNHATTAAYDRWWDWWSSSRNRTREEVLKLISESLPTHRTVLLIEKDNFCDFFF